jgi:hypothetical protein
MLNDTITNAALATVRTRLDSIAACYIFLSRTALGRHIQQRPGHRSAARRVVVTLFRVSLNRVCGQNRAVGPRSINACSSVFTHEISGWYRLSVGAAGSLSQLYLNLVGYWFLRAAAVFKVSLEVIERQRYGTRIM